MRGDRLVVAVALLALLAAGVAAGIIGTPARALRGSDAGEEFLRAWERSRRETYVVASAFTRTLRDGRTLASTTTTVQRPPDRLVIGGGSVNGRLDGRVVRCLRDTAGTPTCVTGDPAPPYDEEVAKELATLREYVAGVRPLYRALAQRRGCFRLDLALDFPSPPYGRRATFCFDPTTGALTLIEVIRDEGVDTTVATDVRAEVRRDDLTLPA